MAKAKQEEKQGWEKIKNTYVYHFNPNKREQYKCKSITFHGYDRTPVGFQLYKSGGGFNSKQINRFSGDALFKHLNKKLKKELVFHIYRSDKTRSTFNKEGKSYVVTLSAKDFEFLVRDLGKRSNEYKAELLETRLSQVFKYKYNPKDGKLSAKNLLPQFSLTNLDEHDHKAMIKFFKEYYSLYQSKKEVEGLATSFIIEGKRETLKRIIKEYEMALKNTSFSEKKWQDFLHNKVFKFMTNYVESFRETDVNFGAANEGEKKPDFVWIDFYGFLDVFEIKTPHKDILAKRIDKSHNNYYFSGEVIKAISQIEKYILFLERNVEKYKTYLQKKTSLPFSVIKPKAFLLIGNSEEFSKNDRKKEDLRVLRRSLKNIEIITFNELLDNLKNILAKIEQTN